MHSIMLGTGPELTVAGIFGSLKTAHHGYAHATSQIGVFPICLLSTTPSGITEDIHVWRPNGKAMEFLVRTTLVHSMMILGAHFCRSSVKHLIQQCVIKGRSHGNRLREHRHVAHIGSTMQGLTPPKEFLDAQTGNSLRFVTHQKSLLFECQTAEQVFGTFLITKCWILERKGLCIHRGRHKRPTKTY